MEVATDDQVSKTNLATTVIQDLCERAQDRCERRRQRNDRRDDRRNGQTADKQNSFRSTIHRRIPISMRASMPPGQGLIMSLVALVT